MNTVTLNTAEEILDRKSTVEMNTFLLNTSFLDEDADYGDYEIYESYMPRESELED